MAKTAEFNYLLTVIFCKLKQNGKSFNGLIFYWFCFIGHYFFTALQESDVDCCNGWQTVENNVQTLSLADWMQLPGLTFAEWRDNYWKW